jgi:hypothetical protein
MSADSAKQKTITQRRAVIRSLSSALCTVFHISVEPRPGSPPSGTTVILLADWAGGSELAALTLDATSSRFGTRAGVFDTTFDRRSVPHTGLAKRVWQGGSSGLNAEQQILVCCGLATRRGAESAFGLVNAAR